MERLEINHGGGFNVRRGGEGAKYIVFAETPSPISLLGSREYIQHQSSRGTYIARLGGKKIVNQSLC